MQFEVSGLLTSTLARENESALVNRLRIRAWNAWSSSSAGGSQSGGRTAEIVGLCAGRHHLLRRSLQAVGPEECFPGDGHVRILMKNGPESGFLLLDRHVRHCEAEELGCIGVFLKHLHKPCFRQGSSSIWIRKLHNLQQLRLEHGVQEVLRRRQLQGAEEPGLELPVLLQELVDESGRSLVERRADDATGLRTHGLLLGCKAAQASSLR
mmetsp:Transcript_3815/g.8927  ORF Transcript_3815/g.8927 Transcript_3815/m.8927 type:complete len:210 (-) Transcript_3815:844-1473(-)